MDVVLLGLPHKVSAQKVPELFATGARIVDLSGDFRLRSAAGYERYYGADHPCPDELTTARSSTGCPELNREAIRKAKYVASPGCFATTIELGAVAAREGGAARRAPSRSSASPDRRAAASCRRAGTHHPVRAVNLRTYKPLDHQHIPEIEETLASAGAKDLTTVRFVPVSAPLSRGIFATSFAHVGESVSADQVSALYAGAFAKEPFVRVPSEAPPRGRGGQRHELRRGRRAVRPGRRRAKARHVLLGDRQPHQGRRRARPSSR